MKTSKTILIVLLILAAMFPGIGMLTIYLGTQGIDVSHHNIVSWETVARETDVKFAFIKITEGATFVDPAGKGNISSAEKAGIKTGAYHFFSTQSNPTSQFLNFKRNFVEQSSLVPMVDVEVLDGISLSQLNDNVKEFCLMVEEEYGVKPVIYTSAGLYHIIFGVHDAKFWKDYTFFFWQPVPIHPMFSTGRPRCIWQYSTSKARIAGTSIIDRDVLSFMSVEDLLRNP